MRQVVAGDLIRTPDFKPSKTGRKRAGGKNKKSITMRIDEDLHEALKQTGEGWTTRINDALRKLLLP